MTTSAIGTAALATVVTRALLAAALTFSTLAHGAIRGGINSNDPANGATELVFLAWDNNTADDPKVVFSKDLGITMDQFFISAQQDGGAQQFWYLGGTGTGNDGDALWTQFLNTEVSPGVRVDPAKVQWAIFALDADVADPQDPDDYRLFTTLRQATSGSATVITGLSDVTTTQLNIVSAPMNNFVVGANQLPGHANNENGSAIALKPQGGILFPFGTGDNALIGQGGTLTYNGGINAPAGNLIGQSSWFYRVNRNESEEGQFDESLPVAIDEFDNLGSDGYWGLAAASDPARSGQYFLSYTIAAFESQAERAAGLLYGNNFARLGGVLSLSSASGRGATVLGLANSFVRGIAQSRLQATGTEGGRAFVTAASGVALGIDGDRALASLTTAVPEPQTWLLLGAGLGLLALRTGQTGRQGQTGRRSGA